MTVAPPAPMQNEYAASRLVEAVGTTGSGDGEPAAGGDGPGGGGGSRRSSGSPARATTAHPPNAARQPAAPAAAGRIEPACAVQTGTPDCFTETSAALAAG